MINMPFITATAKILSKRTNKKASYRSNGPLDQVTSDAYHDVAYNTNTLAARDIALRASLEMFTPSGSWGKRNVILSDEIQVIWI